VRGIVAGALLALALAAPAAQAAPAELPLLPPLPQSRVLAEHGKSVRPKPEFRSGFVVEADGYQVGVTTFGNAVSFEVWRRSGKQQVLTAYLARGVARPERLQATFGKFGKISMRFRESRGGPRSICRFGQLLVKRRGVFVGNLRFRGEGGYVSVRLHQAKGAIVTPGKRCRYRPSRRDSLRDFIELFLSPKAALLSLSRDGVDLTAFLALEAKRSSLFAAIDEESRGKLAIVRLCEVSRPRRIRADETLTAASVSPPAPFHGVGRYRAAPDGTTTWSGDLSVNFPGAPRFPITGPDFESFLEVPF
jgi:hypothetical protein